MITAQENMLRYGVKKCKISKLSDKYKLMMSEMFKNCFNFYGCRLLIMRNIINKNGYSN